MRIPSDRRGGSLLKHRERIAEKSSEWVREVLRKMRGMTPLPA